MAEAMAKKIRASVGEDQFDADLAGFTQEQAADLIHRAFQDPIESDAFRVTFVIGGGKLVRARYDEQLPKWLGAALRVLGYAEDRGAALGSQAVFKQQHDTGA